MNTKRTFEIKIKVEFPELADDKTREERGWCPFSESLESTFSTHGVFGGLKCIGKCADIQARVLEIVEVLK